MTLTRPSRFVAALIALFSVLFMQFAVAAYACPGMSHAGAAMTANLDRQAMSGCEGMDMEQPNLCHAYGQAGDQSLDKPQPPHVAPFVPVQLMLAWSAGDVVYPTIAAEPESFLLKWAAAPPISIRNCCFRI